MVFLHEGARGDVFAKPVVAEGFHKEAALVTVDLGLEEFDVGKGGGEDVHGGRWVGVRERVSGSLCFGAA